MALVFLSLILVYQNTFEVYRPHTFNETSTPNTLSDEDY